MTRFKEGRGSQIDKHLPPSTGFGVFLDIWSMLGWKMRTREKVRGAIVHKAGSKIPS